MISMKMVVISIFVPGKHHGNPSLLQFCSEILQSPSQCSLQQGDNVDICGLYYSGHLIAKKSSIRSMRMIVSFHFCAGKMSRKLTPCSELAQRLLQDQASAICKRVVMSICVSYIILGIELQEASLKNKQSQYIIISGGNA